MIKKLYLCCYDIECNKTRAKIFREIAKYQSGGQYSAYECYLSTSERKRLYHYLQSLLDDNDSLSFQLLSDFDNIYCLGAGVKPENADFLYLG